MTVFERSNAAPFTEPQAPPGGHATLLEKHWAKVTGLATLSWPMAIMPSEKWGCVRLSLSRRSWSGEKALPHFHHPSSCSLKAIIFPKKTYRCLTDIWESINLSYVYQIHNEIARHTYKRVPYQPIGKNEMLLRIGWKRNSCAMFGEM